jgi:hypothetical protein
VWWRWYYWASPFAWTLYGLATSQFGDISDEVVMADGGKQHVNKFLRSYFGYNHDFLGPVFLHRSVFYVICVREIRVSMDSPICIRLYFVIGEFCIFLKENKISILI